MTGSDQRLTTGHTAGSVGATYGKTEYMTAELRVALMDSTYWQQPEA
jgi:hypothetical protein